MLILFLFVQSTGIALACLFGLVEWLSSSRKEGEVILTRTSIYDIEISYVLMLILLFWYLIFPVFVIYEFVSIMKILYGTFLITVKNRRNKKKNKSSCDILF